MDASLIMFCVGVGAMAVISVCGLIVLRKQISKD